jgi:TonB family protein
MLLPVVLVGYWTGSAAAQAVETATPHISVAPKATASPQPTFPEAARAAGHHGTVMLSGMLGSDGSFGEVSIKQSSGSPILDQAALDGVKAWRFTPALDGAGRPMAMRINVPVEFYSFKTPDGGINHYTCRQWVADSDWYAATFPDPKKDQFYMMMSGFSFVGALTTGRTSAAALRAQAERFDRNWTAALAHCRSHPGKLVRDVLPLR